MDLFITGVSIGGLSIFMVIHILVAQNVRDGSSVRWLFKLLLLISGGILVGASIYYMFAPGAFLADADSIIAYVLILMLFSSWWLVYMMTIYSFSEASITLRLLSEISTFGYLGATKQEIMKRYNKKIIIKRRIERLLESGELKKIGPNYLLTGAVSGFILRNFVHKVFFTLFPKLP